jgi:hypothetical protein
LPEGVISIKQEFAELTELLSNSTPKSESVSGRLKALLEGDFRKFEKNFPQFIDRSGEDSLD